MDGWMDGWMDGRLDTLKIDKKLHCSKSAELRNC